MDVYKQGGYLWTPQDIRDARAILQIMPNAMLLERHGCGDLVVKVYTEVPDDTALYDWRALEKKDLRTYTKTKITEVPVNPFLVATLECGDTQRIRDIINDGAHTINSHFMDLLGDNRCGMSDFLNDFYTTPFNYYDPHDPGGDDDIKI